jgi:hypothetical protein
LKVPKQIDKINPKYDTWTNNGMIEGVYPFHRSFVIISDIKNADAQVYTHLNEVHLFWNLHETLYLEIMDVNVYFFLQWTG